MIRTWDTPTTIAELRKIDRNGNDTTYEDCVVAIEMTSHGRLQFDLRGLRPIRINDRDGLVITLDINEVMDAIAENLRQAVKE